MMARSVSLRTDRGNGVTYLQPRLALPRRRADHAIKSLSFFSIETSRHLDSR